MQAQRTRRLEELNYFNAVCCLLVVLIHILSLGVTQLDKGSWQLAVIYFPWNLSAFVVPGFLFTGAVKMALGFHSSDGTPYLKYIWRRIKKIYLPYVAFVIVYYPIFVHFGIAQRSVRAFFSYLFVGNLSSHFYYIVIVMQFYILMPLWRWMVKHVPWYAALPVSAMVTLLMLKASAALGCIGITFKYSDRVFLSYLFFWVMGLYVGQNYESFRTSLRQSRLPVLLSAAAVLVFSAVNYLQYTKSTYVYDTGYLKLFSDAISILVLLCLCTALDSSPMERTKRVLGGVYKASYSVYLSHSLFLTVGTIYLQRLGVTDIALLLALRTVIAYTLPFALYFGYSKVKTLIIKH